MRKLVILYFNKYLYCLEDLVKDWFLKTCFFLESVQWLVILVDIPEGDPTSHNCVVGNNLVTF